MSNIHTLSTEQIFNAIIDSNVDFDSPHYEDVLESLEHALEDVAICNQFCNANTQMIECVSCGDSEPMLKLPAPISEVVMQMSITTAKHTIKGCNSEKK